MSVGTFAQSEPVEYLNDEKSGWSFIEFNSDNSGIITSVYFIGLTGASQAMKIK